MQLEPADAAGRDEAPGFGDAVGAAVRIDAGEGHRDVGVRRGEVRDLVVRELRAPRQPLVHREHHARHAARSVVLGQAVRSRAAPLSPKYWRAARSAAEPSAGASRCTCTSMAILSPAWIVEGLVVTRRSSFRSTSMKRIGGPAP